GVVSNSLILGFVYNYAYGCEFSPDGTKFYAGGFIGSYICQWDLCAGSNSAIAASQTVVGSNSGFGSLQLAPDGKIYVARSITPGYIGIIENPNLAGLSCNLTPTAIALSPGTCGVGLPNFVSSFFHEAPPFTYTLFPCNTFSFSAPLTLYAASGNTISNVF